MSFTPWTNGIVIDCGGVETASDCGAGARLNGSVPPSSSATGAPSAAAAIPRLPGAAAPAAGFATLNCAGPVCRR